MYRYRRHTWQRSCTLSGASTLRATAVRRPQGQQPLHADEQQECTVHWIPGIPCWIRLYCRFVCRNPGGAVRPRTLSAPASSCAALVQLAPSPCPPCTTHSHPFTHRTGRHGRVGVQHPGSTTCRRGHTGGWEGDTRCTRLYCTIVAQQPRPCQWPWAKVGSPMTQPRTGEPPRPKRLPHG